MKISKDTVVELAYRMAADGTVIGGATESEPQDYIHGNNMLIPRLEETLEGRQPGDAFSVTIAPEDAYGQHNDLKVVSVPKKAFEIDGVLREDILGVGKILPMVNGNGKVEQGLILEITEDSVRMDFNHVLAGKTLTITGTVLSVREATEKELKEGLHGEFLPVEEGGHCCHGHGHGCCHGEGHHDGGCCHEGSEGGCHHEGENEGCCHGDGHCHKS